MSATKEHWNYSGGERVWVGKYKNSQNTLHWHKDCELIYAERGALDVAVDGANYRLTAGGAMFIAGECIHKINAAEPNTVLQTIIFDSGIINDFASGVALCSPLLSADYGLPQTYNKLMKELTEKKPLYTHETAAEINRVMLDIFRAENTEPKKSKTKADAKLKSLFVDINNRYDTYTLNDAAAFMGMNASYLSRFFAAKTGMHFMRYLNYVRVKNAVAMLALSSYNITEIAEKCGFGTIRNFNRTFKIITGYSPSKLPDGYSFTAVEESDSREVNPTLIGCELIECSSQR